MEISQEQFQQLVVDPRTALHIRERQPKPWKERRNEATHHFATKIRENLPTVLNIAKEVAINGAVGFAAGGVARIALAGTGVGWLGAVGGGMVTGAAVEAVRELRAHQALEVKKLAFAGLKGAISGAIGFEVLGLLSQTGIGSAVGSMVSEKFSGLGCNFHNSANSTKDIFDAVVLETKISPYAPDYCNNPLAGIDVAALVHQNLPTEIAPALSSGLLADQTLTDQVQSNIQALTQDVLSTGDNLVHGLSEIGSNATTLAQEKWQEVSSILAPHSTQAQVDLPASQPELPQIPVDAPPVAEPHLPLADYTFDEIDPKLGTQSSLLGAADYDAARDILLTHQQIDLDLVKDGSVALIDGQELNRFELYNWVVDNYQVDHDQMTKDFMGVMRQATASSYGYDFLVPTEDGKDFLIPHFTLDEQKFVLKRIATGVAGRFFG